MQILINLSSLLRNRLKTQSFMMFHDPCFLIRFSDQFPSNVPPDFRQESARVPACQSPGDSCCAPLSVPYPWNRHRNMISTQQWNRDHEALECLNAFNSSLLVAAPLTFRKHKPCLCHHCHVYCHALVLHGAKTA